MEKRRPVDSKRRYLLAFLIGTLIFVIVLGITYSIAYIEYQRISEMQGTLSYKIFEDKLEYTLFDSDVCSSESYLKISQDLRFQGSIIGTLEQKLGKDDKDVLFRKKYYSLIQLEHFELVNLINERCNESTNTILFFYSNEEEELIESERVGNILGVLFERNSDNLLVYSFDMNLNSNLIRSLKNKYRVTAPYTVILNEDQDFRKISNIDEIEPYLK